jgi:hypothetical protein
MAGNLLLEEERDNNRRKQRTQPQSQRNGSTTTTKKVDPAPKVDPTKVDPKRDEDIAPTIPPR